jgi:sortase (surface protein transpeptidase)
VAGGPVPVPADRAGKPGRPGGRARDVLLGVAVGLAVASAGLFATGAAAQFTAPVAVDTTVAGPDAGSSPPGPPGPVAAPPPRGPRVDASPPSRVTIPDLGVSAPLVRLGLARDGSLQVPADATRAGWFTGGPAPGSLGPAVLAGHVDWQGRAGAFARLGELKPGNLVNVTRADGTVAVFAVTRVERHPKDRFPTRAVYGPVTNAALRLVTCGGAFDRRTGQYRDNVVVYADLVHVSAPRSVLRRS